MSGAVEVDAPRIAPGAPGTRPTWCRADKQAVGTAIQGTSRVWFTLASGNVTEVYYPRIDRPALRDLGVLLRGADGTFYEDKRDARHTVAWMRPGVPAFDVTSHVEADAYALTKRVLADPARDALLVQLRWRGDVDVFVIANPRLGGEGSGQLAYTGTYDGVPMLFAEHDACALALAVDTEWAARSVGHVGVSDGWQLLSRGEELAPYSAAGPGHVALTGRLTGGADGGSAVVAIGFGTSVAEAGQRARASLLAPFSEHEDAYARGWEHWHATRAALDGEVDADPTDATVLRIHESKAFRGATIASLSIPWGEDRGDADRGGYHLVWPRDLVETAGGLLAVGARQDALRAIDYLASTQLPDGGWPQNMWLDGTPYWGGTQLDEAALPILLIDLADREHDVDCVRRYWPMVRRAAGFLVRNGPSTPQDRWEEDAGLTSFTLAAEIAALRVASGMASALKEAKMARYLSETADAWDRWVEHWTWAEHGPLARGTDAFGYYVRVASRSGGLRGRVAIKNRAPGLSVEADETVSPDALALARFGVRDAGDPRLAATAVVIDAHLARETPRGVAFLRYNGDGYGEAPDGAPFDGRGCGRPWPLLSGERAHFELARGRAEDARRYRAALEAFRSSTGLIPEQVWDAAPIPERHLAPGGASGSARPLVWAHAEAAKLTRSLSAGRVFDRVSVAGRGVDGSRVVWRADRPVPVPAGTRLRVETCAPGTLRWSVDGWTTIHEDPLEASGLGTYYADLPTLTAPAGQRLVFTFHWEDGGWAGVDYEVVLRGDDGASA
ncbi:MAG: glycoside hydrolase family 15 protein [Sandaracinaceae bacterium]